MRFGVMAGLICAQNSSDCGCGHTSELFDRSRPEGHIMT